jgi:hypothetical protein
MRLKKREVEALEKANKLKEGELVLLDRSLRVSKHGVLMLYSLQGNEASEQIDQNYVNLIMDI